MRCTDIEDRLIDVAPGGLESPDPAVRAHLESCPRCRSSVERTQRAWTLLAAIPDAEPDSPAMRARFAATLEQHRPPRTAWRPRWRLAYGIGSVVIALAAGVAIGRQLPVGGTVGNGDLGAMRRELREVREMLTLSLLQQSAASERIKGVSAAARMDDPPTDVVSALLDTLAHDPSVNVRLASLRALERLGEHDSVRHAVAEAVTREQSPLVSIALIDFIVEARDRDAVEPLRHVSQDHGRDSAVRETAARAVERLLGGGGV
jgi:hypothetical protein